jgi:putative flippase GtrA
VGFVGFPALWGNVIATAVGTVPSFELNRRWVWSERSRGPTVRQVVPFCSLAFAGLVLSSLAVRIAGGLTANSGRGLHTIAVEFANVGTYGALWVVQFILCDRWLFGRPRPGSPEPDRDGEAPRGAGDRHCASSYAKTS